MYTPNQQTVHRTQLRKQSDSVTSAPDCALSHFMHCTYVLTTRSKVLLQKLTGFQLVKKFPTFYGTRRFITSFTTAHHMFLSQASSIQSIPPTSHFLNIQLNIILPSTPGSTKWSLATCPAHPILIDFITRTIF